jgi:chemotaxis protein MotB
MGPIRRKQYLVDEQENIERWLLSYADFITLLFAFFVLMYAASSINEAKYRALSGALGDAFHRPSIELANPSAVVSPNSTSSPDIPPLKRVAEDLQASLKSMIDEGTLRITETPLGVTLEIKDTALFDSGKASLPPRALETLTKITQPLQNISNEIRVEGFTDNIPIKNSFFPSNWELSAARAGSVVRLFTEHGILSSRLVAIGHAENLPLSSNDSSEGRAQNRRVSITILHPKQKGDKVVTPLSPS